ncbi:MAG: hypothetical protein M3Y79_09260 [Pseudomonadota bacterium]|nr:hypothetical protein [Pseudomonadota bacterium]
MTPDQAQQLEHFHRQHAQLQPWCLEAIEENPALFGYIGPTRGELRQLPLKFILWATPPLVFPKGSPAAPLTHELQDWRRRMERVGSDVDARKLVAVQARRTWSRLVELASGINMQISPDRLITVELRDV